MQKYLLIVSLMISACASSPKFTVQKSTDNRSPASGGVVSLNLSTSCNRFDPVSSAANGRWRSQYSMPWDSSMISELQSQGVISQVTMMTDDGTQNKITLDLGQPGMALASKLSSTTYFERYNLTTDDDKEIGMFLVSYDMKDKVADPTSTTTRRAKSILLFFGVASAKMDTITCKHASNVSEISNSGCTLIDDKTSISTSKESTLCFDPTLALNGYQNSF